VEDREGGDGGEGGWVEERECGDGGEGGWSWRRGKVGVKER